VTLFRPVGQKEYELIADSGFKTFPPRLPEQPIFYPVLCEKYALEITLKWNLKHNRDKKGYVMRFEVADGYAAKFPVQTAGANYHQELWVPAEELDEFNQHIIGFIEVVHKFDSYGGVFNGNMDSGELRHAYFGEVGKCVTQEEKDTLWAAYFPINEIVLKWELEDKTLKT